MMSRSKTTVASACATHHNLRHSTPLHPLLEPVFVSLMYRFWEGLPNRSSLATVLENILQAWIVCMPPNSPVSPNQGAARHMHASHNGHHGGTAVDTNEADRKSLKPVEGQGPIEGQASASSNGVKDSTISANFVPAGQGRGTQEDGHPHAKPRKLTTSSPDHVATRNVPPEGLKTVDAAPTDAISSIVNSLQEDMPDPGITQSKRSSPVRVLGFAVELDSSLRKARAALIAEWPGVGSLQDLISGKIQDTGGGSQEDLLRWTRQIAEGLTHTSSGGSNTAGKGSAPRVSTRTAYLFQRPVDEFQQGAGMLDVRVRCRRQSKTKAVVQTTERQTYITGTRFATRTSG